MRHVSMAAAVVLLAETMFPGSAFAGPVMGSDLTVDRNGFAIEADRSGGFARPRQVYLLQGAAPATVENPDATVSPRYVTEDTYPAGSPDTAVRIANGGAGATGLIEALAHAYLKEFPNGADGKPYAVAWYLSDTTFSLEALRQKVVDIAVTYDETLENLAVESGEASRRDPVFMDHFMIVGPASNPAEIGIGDDPTEAFAKIASAGCDAPYVSPSSPDCAYFLSRDDKSATEFKERAIFDAVFAADDRFFDLRERGYTDEAKASWYYKCPQTPKACFPPDALKLSNDDGLYTLTDWGTWLANGGERMGLPNLRIYVTGIGPAGHTLFLNPAAGLLSPLATPEARRFYDWMLGAGGQAVIAEYGAAKFGQALYRPR